MGPHTKGREGAERVESDVVATNVDHIVNPKAVSKDGPADAGFRREARLAWGWAAYR